MDVVRTANILDLKYVLSLSQKERKTIGFIPKIAYEAAITGIKTGKRWTPTCNDRLFVVESNDDLTGFCLASFGNPLGKFRRGKVSQICIQADARQIARGKMLLAEVIIHGIKVGCRNFGCGCADDLESNVFWVAMGWELVGQRKGAHYNDTRQQTSDRIINIYLYDDPNQLKLF